MAGVSELPEELILHIFKHLDVGSIWCVALVCKQWRRISDDYAVFRALYRSHFSRARNLQVAIHVHTSRHTTTTEPEANALSVWLTPASTPPASVAPPSGGEEGGEGMMEPGTSEEETQTQQMETQQTHSRRARPIHHPAIGEALAAYTTPVDNIGETLLPALGMVEEQEGREEGEEGEGSDGTDVGDVGIVSSPLSAPPVSYPSFQNSRQRRLVRRLVEEKEETPLGIRLKLISWKELFLARYRLELANTMTDYELPEQNSPSSSENLPPGSFPLVWGQVCAVHKGAWRDAKSMLGKLRGVPNVPQEEVALMKRMLIADLCLADELAVTMHEELLYCSQSEMLIPFSRSSVFGNGWNSEELVKALLGSDVNAWWANVRASLARLIDHANRADAVFAAMDDRWVAASGRSFYWVDNNRALGLRYWANSTLLRSKIGERIETMRKALGLLRHAIEGQGTPSRTVHLNLARVARDTALLLPRESEERKTLLEESVKIQIELNSGPNSISRAQRDLAVVCGDNRAYQEELFVRAEERYLAAIAEEEDSSTSNNSRNNLGITLLTHALIVYGEERGPEFEELIGRARDIFVGLAPTEEELEAYDVQQAIGGGGDGGGDPPYVWAYFSLGRLYGALGDGAQARFYLERFVTYHGDVVSAMNAIEDEEIHDSPDRLAPVRGCEWFSKLGASACASEAS